MTPTDHLLALMLSGQLHVQHAWLNFLFAIGMLIASYAIQALLTPKQNNTPDKASMKDFDFPQITEGTPQIVVFGDVWIQDWMITWYGNMRTSAIKSSGGKK